MGLLSHLRRPSLNLALQWRHLGKMARLGSMGCRPRSWDLLGFLSSPHCGELRKPIRIPREVPATNRPPGRLLSVSAGASLQGAARNPRANPHEHSISLGQGWSSGGCSALVSCAPNRKSGPLIPSLSFPPQLTKVLPAQVARSARRRSTSRLHERARHVWRRGIVKRLLRYRLEGHFRSQSFISRILIDATP